MEQQIANIQEQLAENHTTNDSKMKFELVKGENGTCKRCEAFVIANGQTIQKLKTLRTENVKLKLRITNLQGGTGS